MDERLKSSEDPVEEFKRKINRVISRFSIDFNEQEIRVPLSCDQSQAKEAFFEILKERGINPQYLFTNNVVATSNSRKITFEIDAYALQVSGTASILMEVKYDDTMYYKFAMSPTRFQDRV